MDPDGGRFAPSVTREGPRGTGGQAGNRERHEGREISLDEQLGRQLPHSLTAERAVLGSLLLLPEVCDEVSLIVRPSDFYSDIHARLFQHMLDLHNGQGRIDPLLIAQRLRDSAEYDQVGGTPYLMEVSQSVSSAAHAEHYARIVRDKAMLRNLIHASTDILRDAYEPQAEAREMLARSEQRVFAILEDRGDNRVCSIKDILDQALARIDMRMRHDHGSGGLETGFDDFDDLTGGLHPNELVILAARPSMGKTALALNIVEHVAIDCLNPTLFVSLEMSSLELADRILCSRSRVNSHRLRNGQLTTEENARLARTASDISHAPLFVDDSPSRTMTEIAATARRLKRSHGLSLVAIDYLQLIDPDNPRDPRQEQVAKIARRLKGLARELQVPVLCLGQLNRQVEATRDNRPQLSHLRESGAIEQDADVVMFVHREEYYCATDEERQEHRGLAELMVRKQRNGPVGDIKLTWLHDFTRFTNAAPRPYEEFDSTYAGEGF